MGAVQTKLAIGLALGIGVLGWVGWGLSRALQQSVSVYWLTDANNDIHYVIEERTVNALNSDRAIAAGLNILIDGHPQDQLLSAVPAETELLGAKQDGDEIYLDFSEEFASGGGASSLLGRVTQVLYTATSATPTAKVWISVEGEPVEVLSGEGLVVEQPLTRDSFPPSFKDYIASPQELEQALESNPLSHSEYTPNADPGIPDPLQDSESLQEINDTGGTLEVEHSSALTSHSR
ncbi:MAG: GerMN domain-containing protein [Cyanobacteria bacterium P01_E01_bin.34]